MFREVIMDLVYDVVLNLCEELAHQGYTVQVKRNASTNWAI